MWREAVSEPSMQVPSLGGDTGARPGFFNQDLMEIKGTRPCLACR